MFYHDLFKELSVYIHFPDTFPLWQLKTAVFPRDVAVLQVSPLAVPLLVSSLCLCQGAPLALPCLPPPLSWHLLTLGPGCCCQDLPKEPLSQPAPAKESCWHCHHPAFYGIFLSSFFLILSLSFGSLVTDVEICSHLRVWIGPRWQKTKFKQIVDLLLVASIYSHLGTQKQIQKSSEILFIV